MNAELKAKWLAALRSGEYVQGEGRLRGEGNSYCCLGVLCDISGLGDWSADEYVVDGARYTVDLTPYDQRTVPRSETLAYLLGITDPVITQCVNLNDGISEGEETSEGPSSFNEIADYLDANL